MSGKDPYIGREFDGYRIERALGRGGMGTVYGGVDTGLRRRVAIKVLPQSAAANEDLRRRFEREARVVAEFDHPNIARVYRTGEIDGLPYYAMEYIEGKSLADMLRDQGRVAGNACIRLMTQAAQGLKAAAARQVIHRDIKPANLMVTDDGMLKIVDFGIAKAVRDDTFQTATGAVMGTPRYIAPEQARGLELDHRADIYSLGATFYHMVTGVPPFDSDDPITLVMMHINQPVEPIERFNPHVPDNLERIIYRMLEKSPARRYQDYGKLVDDLEHVFTNAGQQTAIGVPRRLRPGAAPGMPGAQSDDVPSVVGGTIVKQGGKSKVWLWVAAAVVLAALLALPVFLRPQTEEAAAPSAALGDSDRPRVSRDLTEGLESGDRRKLIPAAFEQIKAAKDAQQRESENMGGR